MIKNITDLPVITVVEVAQEIMSEKEMINDIRKLNMTGEK
jgi:hypothetical protein